jgi:hypothetical protein
MLSIGFQYRFTLYFLLQIELDGGTYTDPNSSPGCGSAKILSPTLGPHEMIQMKQASGTCLMWWW